MIAAMNRPPSATGARRLLRALTPLTALAFLPALAGTAFALPQLPGAEPTPPPTPNAPSVPSTPQATPQTDAPVAEAPPAPPPKSSEPAVAVDMRRGLVTVEHGGHTVGVGTVLGGDGRILTALSGLRGADQVDVRYADRHMVHARVGHRDPAWDLALLIPLSGKWTDGLTASEADPSNGELKIFLSGGRAAPVAGHVKARIDARAKDGANLSNALELEVRGTPVVGAPLIDAKGSVVGILVRACKPVEPVAPVCLSTVYGAPVAAIRDFLVTTPMNAVAPSPWLGIVGAPDAVGNTRGVRVMQVAPSSPAAKAGLKTNTDQALAHLIVAVDGNPVDTPEKLADRISRHSVGESVKLLVLESEKFKEVSVVLRAPP